MRGISYMRELETYPPLVSAIMPTYNHAKFIGEAIQSVLNQTYKNFELLIIDNYSEDNTGKIVTSYKDDRIKYFKFRNNGIIAASRNHGIKHAQGEYIAFIDSDDLWLPEKLEKQVIFLNKHTECFLVYSKSFLQQKNGENLYTRPKKKDLKEGKVFKELFLSNNFILILTVLMKNNIEGTPYFFDEDRDLIAIEDYDLWLNIAKTEIIGYINEPLTVYRIHEANISKGILSYFKRNLKIIYKYRHDVDIVTIFKKLIYLIGYTSFGLSKTN